MSSARHPFATLALAAGLVAVTMPAAEAHSCRRLNKTQGAIVGGTGGAVLGAVLTGGVTGAVIGAAAGGIAGHEIARKKHHKCYRARSR
jgi:hypothetical protein